MLHPESGLFCRLDGLSVAQQQQRLLALADLGLPKPETIPVFEEAAQTAARFLNAPIGIVGIIEGDWEWLQAAVGLSRLGLMNPIASSRKIAVKESFCIHTLDSGQCLQVSDATTHAAFSQNSLVQHYGIRAYLGVPLLTSEGICIGTLAVMDAVPHAFTDQETEFLAMTARWCISEFEKGCLLDGSATRSLRLETPAASARSLDMKEQHSTLPASNHLSKKSSAQVPLHLVKLELLTQLTQELRTPLTSVIGMASVLSREIYGPLTDKQKEYLGIIQGSSQNLLALVNEILELGSLDADNQSLDLASVDVEMLCQKAITALEESAERQEKEIRLSVEPNYRIWVLDKNKLRRLVYHLLSSVIQTAATGGTIRIHLSHKQGLNIAVWVSHPFLGDGLRLADPDLDLFATDSATNLLETETASDSGWNNTLPKAASSEATELGNASTLEGGVATAAIPEAATGSSQPQKQEDGRSRDRLELFLSSRLAELHGGKLSIQGSLEAGYRYVVNLPSVAPASEGS